MVERDGEPLQRIVEMWKRAVGFLSLFEAPNLPEIPLELLLREPRHSVLPLQRVHLQVKVEILFRLNISFSLIHALRISSRRFSSRKFTKEFHWTRSPNLVSSIIPSQLFASSCVILLREIDEFKKERKEKKICFRVCINVTANIDYLSIIVTHVRRIRIVRCIEVERWKNSDRRLLERSTRYRYWWKNVITRGAWRATS